MCILKSRMEESLLSPYVKKLILIDENKYKKESLNYNYFLDDLTINWDNINTLFTDCLGDFNIHKQSFSWCETKVEEVKPIILNSLSIIENANHEKLDTLFKFCYWTKRAEDIRNCILNKIPVLESVLTFTSIFERAVGNVLFSYKKSVPFLLRDLLNTSECNVLFGNVPINFSQILLGSPKTLNLRNVCWHGFISIEELHKSYKSILFLLICSFGKILTQKNILHETLHVRPQFIKTTHYSNLINNTFSVLPNLSNYIPICRDIFSNSPFIKQHFKTYWISILNYYQNKSLGQCLILLLPQFETLMRHIFCHLNKCKHRLLTAEADTLYTTLDDVFDESVKDNQIYSVLNRGVLELYYDIFTAQRGPRLRDKLSHGEIDFNDISETTVNIVLCLVCYVILKVNDTESNEFYDILSDRINNYTSIFHPNAFLKRQTIKATDSLLNWMNFSYPDKIQDFLSESLIIELKLGFLYGTKCNKDNNSLNNTLVVLQVPVFRRPKCEAELVNVLIQIVERILLIDEIIKESTSQKYQLFIEKKLRSQQRQSYVNLLNVLPYLNCSLVCVLHIVTFYMRLMFQQNISQESIKDYLKFLKKILAYVENVSSNIHQTKNRWDKINKLSDSFYKLCNDVKLFKL